MNNKRGFTLIELLVVISIIGVLSALIINNLNDARTRARDAKRKQELSSLKTALRLYYNDNQTYPLTGSLTAGAAFTSTDGSTIYMNQIPEFRTYTQDDTGNGFTVRVTLENLSDPDLTTSQARCPNADAATDYVVCAD